MDGMRRKNESLEVKVITIRKEKETVAREKVLYVILNTGSRGLVKILREYNWKIKIEELQDASREIW